MYEGSFWDFSLSCNDSDPWTFWLKNKVLFYICHHIEYRVCLFDLACLVVYALAFLIDT